jgi:hypothetical protein
LASAEAEGFADADAAGFAAADADAASEAGCAAEAAGLDAVGVEAGAGLAGALVLPQAARSAAPAHSAATREWTAKRD